MTERPKSLFDILDLEHFRKRTPMYTGDWTITSLAAFINGFGLATSINNLNDNDTFRFNEFPDWIAKYFGWFESTAGWKNIILKECNGDERKALDRFFELYDQFKKR